MDRYIFHFEAFIVSQGFSAFKYAPFGTPLVVSEYMARRAQENMDVMRRVDQELALIKKERTRRKRHKDMPRLTPA